MKAPNDLINTKGKILIMLAIKRLLSGIGLILIAMCLCSRLVTYDEMLYWLQYPGFIAFIVGIGFVVCGIATKINRN